MDPTDFTGYGTVLSGASKVLEALKPAPLPPAPPQRADGYALGGTADGLNSGGALGGSTGGANGGAYGGAWSQSSVDGSNWTVVTGGGVATGGGTSGGNGGLSPVQTNTGPGPVSSGAVTPGNFPAPGSFPFGAQAAGAVVASSSGSMLMLGLGLMAFLLFKR